MPITRLICRRLFDRRDLLQTLSVSQSNPGWSKANLGRADEVRRPNPGSVHPEPAMPASQNFSMMALKIEPIRQKRLPNDSIYATSASTKDWMSMKPDLEAELRATVASLRIKASCHELLLLALLPELEVHQKRALQERLSDMERAEVATSSFDDELQMETETMRWIRAMREALEA